MEPNEAITDPTSNAESMLYAANITGDNRFTQALERNIDFLLFNAPKNSDGIIYHWPGKKIVMVDSYYMAPPALALTGHFEEAVKQVEGFRKLLWSDEDKLFSHMWNDEKMDYFILFLMILILLLILILLRRLLMLFLGE